jgi:hypothetical protein
VWLPPTKDQNSRWTSFKNKLNSWGHLEWLIEEPSRNTVFLDLDISIQNSSILTKTFQKSTNLYLYIPSNSAHPPSCLKGLISGELRRYWLQNNLKDFQDILAKFIHRVALRGHKLKDLTPIFQQAAAQLELKQTSTNNANTNNQNTLFIHWQFHPQGIQRRELRQLYSNLLKPYLDFDKVTIAVSRPKNLRDLLTNARLDYNLEHLLHNKTDIQTNPE